MTDKKLSKVEAAIAKREDAKKPKATPKAAKAKTEDK